MGTKRSTTRPPTNWPGEYPLNENEPRSKVTTRLAGPSSPSAKKACCENPEGRPASRLSNVVEEVGLNWPHAIEGRSMKRSNPSRRVQGSVSRERIHQVAFPSASESSNLAQIFCSGYTRVPPQIYLENNVKEVTHRAVIRRSHPKSAVLLLHRLIFLLIRHGKSSNGWGRDPSVAGQWHEDF